MFANLEIKKALADKKLHQYDLARLLGIAESTCSKMLRDELPKEKAAEILKVIEGVNND